MKTDEVKRMKPKQEQIKEMANAAVRSAVASKAKQEKSLKINNEVLFIKNKEKYAKEIVDIVIKECHFALNKDGKIVSCCDIKCSDCLFNVKRGCNSATLEWANAEYEEPRQSTRKAEDLAVENEALQGEVDNLMRTLEEGREELKAAQHRAEVAERAVRFICDKVMKNHDIVVFPEDRMQVKNKVELYNYCIQQAAKIF